jgi:hypothetical protein
MTLQTLREFFMWCTIITGGVYAVSAVICIFAADWIYRIQSRWFPMPRETFVVVLYAFMGFFKIVFIVFVFVPWLALLIVG